MLNNFPKQRLSYAEKVANNYQWCKDVMHQLLVLHETSSTAPYHVNGSYHRKLANYQLYNNILNQKDFERECNPLGIEVGQFADEIQPYNKTYNKIQVLLGEELKRPFNYKAVLVNSEGIKTKLAHRDKLLREYVNGQIQQTINGLSEHYQKELTEEEVGQLLDPKQIEKHMATTYLEAREILANKLLQYFDKALTVREKKNDAFKHALISGEEFVYVGEHNGEPIMDVLNPLGVFYHKSPDTKYIQDGLYAGYRTMMNSGEILDKYGSYLSKEDISRIDGSPTPGLSNAFLPEKDMRYHHDYNPNYMYSSTTIMEGAYSPSKAEDFLVQHIEWKSQRKIGFLTYTNTFGEKETTLVSEDFKLPEKYVTRTITKDFGRKVILHVWSDAFSEYEMEWGWLPEVWTGTRIGMDIYCMMGPKQNQFRSEDNPYEVKLGYHGLVYSSMNAESTSHMDRMKPFQYLYFIIMHKLKKLIAQDKGKIFHFDTSMVDPEMGLEKTLYYLTEMNIDFYNPMVNATEPGAHQRGKLSGSTDMSQSQHIMNYINLLGALDLQIAEVAGVNRAREGQTSPTEAVTNAQTNLQMSSVITEIYFQAHSNLWGQVLTSLIQVAQESYKDKNIIKQFVMDDMSIATLEVAPGKLADVDLGIFVTDSMKENDLFNSIKNISEALVRTDKATFGDLVKAFKSNSIEELEGILNQSEQNKIQQQQAQSEHEAKLQQELQQQAQAFELQKLEMELDNKLKVAEITSFRNIQDQDSNNNSIPDQLEIDKFKADVSLRNRELDIEEKKVEAMKNKPKASA